MCKTFLVQELMKRLLSFRTDSIFFILFFIVVFKPSRYSFIYDVFRNADASYTVQSSFASLVSMDGTRTR